MRDAISIIGLGKLGTCMAAGIADSGYDVIGVDVDDRIVKAVNQGIAPFSEPELERLFLKNKERLQATDNCHYAVQNSAQSFVIVPTPSLANGSFSIDFVATAFHEIGKALKEKNDYHNIVLTSTVLPGSTRYGLIPVLETAAEKRCGRDFGICYSPLFIALGSVIKNFFWPDFTLIGEFDERSGDTLENLYSTIIKNNSPIKRMSVENAEIAKIALNSFVTTKISFANMLSDLCQNIPGGKIDVVTDALGADTRIGPKYLKGGLGYGGPCFPRDNKALSFILQVVGVKSGLPDITDTMNRQRPQQLLNYCIDKIPKGVKVAVLGLSYKPCTNVVDESQSVILCQLLRDAGYEVIAYDKMITSSIATVMPGIKVSDCLENCLEQAQAVFITTAESQFAELESDAFHGTMEQPVVIIDCWRILNKKVANDPKINYIALGNSREEQKSKLQLQRIWGENPVLQD